MTLLRRVLPRFARLATNAVVRDSRLWRIFRAPLRASFDALAPHWHEVISPEHLAPLEAALDALEGEPRRVLDLGTGTGRAVFAVARRFPRASVVGADISSEMVAHARADVPAELASRVRFDVADADALPYSDGEFDLVTLVNMIPFFDELARVTGPGGRVAFSFSRGEETPIYVPLDRLRSELTRRGFDEFADFRAGSGVALLARKRGAR